ncbi:hypothetical protein LJR153_007262 [Paenibacillus sp. LjRoot153]|uniref:hypothetical protein n=1 Tax=Paenibacillus sp. LjRoot153 TaxID=3342270 RepID=UPI003ECC845A
MVGNLRKVLNKFEESPLIVELLDELEILKKRITYQKNQAELVKKHRRVKQHAARERNVLENIKKDPKKLAHANGESNLAIKTETKRIWITTVSGGSFSSK